jgi:membrane associated rhomboid family serine protease
MESRLVLHAAGIQAEVEHRDGSWLLSVRFEDVERANAELEAYRSENPPPAVVNRPGSTRLGGAQVGVAIYVIVLLYITFLDASDTLGRDWQSAGRVDSTKVLDGQWWRCLTALTLHLDAAHLIANLVFGAVFGLIAGGILGGGVTWLALVIAGGLGNCINAIVQGDDHLSLGASTAVFAGLGLIVSDAIRLGVAEGVPGIRRWTPLVAGLVLFAYTAIGGEQTDVGAHLTGFLVGMLFGWIGPRIPHAWLESRTIQSAAGLLAVLLIGLAWMLALRMSPA